MAKVEKARADMYEDICRFFVEGMEKNKAITLIDKYYRPIFDYRWNREEDYFGHVLIDRGRISGFVGAFFVQRPVNGVQRRFCNLTTWKVREENRSESILMILPFLRMKEYTVTGRTAAKNIFAIHKKLGFSYLDDRVIISPTFISRSKSIGAEAIPSGTALSGILSDADLKLVEDHFPYKCYPFVFEKEGKNLLLIVTVPEKWRFKVAFFQYISDVDLLVELLPLVRKEISERVGAGFLWIEKRLLHGRSIPLSVEYHSPFVHLYKSTELEPSDIDNLYTELVVFNTLENRFY